MGMQAHQGGSFLTHFSELIVRSLQNLAIIKVHWNVLHNSCFQQPSHGNRRDDRRENDRRRDDPSPRGERMNEHHIHGGEEPRRNHVVGQREDGREEESNRVLQAVALVRMVVALILDML